MRRPEARTTDGRTREPISAGSWQDGTSLRKRIRPKLHLHDLACCSLATFDVEGSSGAVGRPKSLTLPTHIGVVDASIHPLGVETHGIGNTQSDELAVDQSEQRLVGVAGGDRHVLPQPKRVELVNPRVVARLSRPWLRDVSHLRSRKRIEHPTLRAMLSRCIRPVQWSPALAAIEACKMPAR